MKTPFDPSQFQLDINRRTFLGRAAYGLGGIALASLLEPALLGQRTGRTSLRDAGEAWLNPPHVPGAGRAVIHLCMAGGPSHLESFDYKPELKRIDGQPFPGVVHERAAACPVAEHGAEGARAFIEFQKHGKSGRRFPSLFPAIAGIADDICIVRSMHTEQINHDPAHAFMNTGSIIKGRPSMGSWLLYGLGAETDDLPGFIVLTSPGQDGPAAGFRAAMVERFLAQQVPGHPVPVQGAGRPLRRQPGGVCQSTSGR